MLGYFSVAQRDAHHWDVSSMYAGAGMSRDFTIRGEPGNVAVRDERSTPAPTQTFKSVQAAMAWICDEYMTETKL